MKQKITIRIVSVILAVIMLTGVIPMSTLTAFAEETGKTESKTTEITETKEELTPGERIEKDMAAREPIVKDRTGISDKSQAAVYENGKLVAQGDFVQMWKRALELAPKITKDTDTNSIKGLKTVEFVLNENLVYKKATFSEKTMTIAGRKLTVDLNGFQLGRSDKGGSVIHIKDYSVVTIMDSNPTSKNAGNVDSHRIWSPNSKGSTIIEGGVIFGGYHSTGDGGGLYVEKHSTVYLTGGTIAGNKADIGSAVYLDDYSILDMSSGKSQICYNYCAGTRTDGGTIFLKSNCSVIGGYIHDNLADDYGGGIRARGGNILLKDITVYNNIAEDYGGGFYVERSGRGQTVTIKGCNIVGNYSDCGGGLYLYDLKMNNMSDCTIERNSSSIGGGGGICVSNLIGTMLTISGKMIIRDNNETKGDTEIESNLYLQGNNDLVVGALTVGSVIGVRKRTDVTSKNGISYSFLSEPTTASKYYFFSDVDGYYVEYQNDPSKDKYHYLYFTKGTRVEQTIKPLSDYSTKELSMPYVIETGKNKGESIPLYKGYAEILPMSDETFVSASPFYYSDGYFFEDPEVYNKHLATMSLNMALAAFGRTTSYVGDNIYANHFANVKQLLSDIGFSDDLIFINDDYYNKPQYIGKYNRLSTIGVAIAQKEITLNDETYTLVPVAIRGGNYGAEWGSNLTLGSEEQSAIGFNDASRQVYVHVQNYVEDYGLKDKIAEGKVKFWVVGYSRGGATANLASAELINTYGRRGNQVFGYTFEAPMGGLETYKESMNYPTIHNTINENDFVTLLAFSEMGFARYGVDHLIGTDHNNGIDISYDVNSAYYTQRTEMIKQLAAINPYYNFEDYWEIADVNIVSSNIPIFGPDLIEKGKHSGDKPNKETENMYDFLRWFVLKVQEDGLGLDTKTIENPDKKGEMITVSKIEDARAAYAFYKPLRDIEGVKESTGVAYSDPKYNFGYSALTIEQSLSNLAALFLGGLTQEQTDVLMPIISNGMSEVMNSSTLTLYNLYVDAIKNWDKNTEKKNSETLNKIIHMLLDKSYNGKTVWDVLNEDEEKVLAESLPVALWFILNYASADYATNKDDSGMWGVGTFINNMNAIMENHYPEVTLAWVRSYDNFYEKDLQAYRIDTATVKQEAPKGTYASATKCVTLSGEAGSSVYYSVDDGKTWNLYTAPVTLEKTPEKILSFSIYRGAKSDVEEISMSRWAGTILGNGNIWFVIIGAAAIVLISVVAVEVSRKKKKRIKNKNF